MNDAVVLDSNTNVLTELCLSHVFQQCSHYFRGNVYFHIQLKKLNFKGNPLFIKKFKTDMTHKQPVVSILCIFRNHLLPSFTLVQYSLSYMHLNLMSLVVRSVLHSDLFLLYRESSWIAAFPSLLSAVSMVTRTLHLVSVWDVLLTRSYIQDFLLQAKLQPINMNSELQTLNNRLKQIFPLIC